MFRGRALYRGALEPLDVGVEDGRIAAIRKILPGGEVFDLGEAILLPGCLDLHVHLRDPGLTEKEDFASGTRSAALGGVTTVVDMPNTLPPVRTAAVLEAKRAAVRGRAAVDYGLYGAPSSGQTVADLQGADAFKVFMAETTGGLKIDATALADVLAAAAPSGKLVSVHAEDPGAFRKVEVRNLQDHARARPVAAEVKAIEALGRPQGEARVHVAHVTSVEGLQAIRKSMTTEATPHHLLLDNRMPLGGYGKVNPPLRSPDERAALWDAFVSGKIDLVASDHAPHTREEKEEGPFEAIPSGMPGVGTSFPLLLRRVHAQELSLERLVTAMAERPAEILGVRKGVLEVGRDADLIVVDPRRIERITAKRVGSKCGWTAFEGMEAVFPRAVYVRGEAVVEDGEAITGGLGQPLPSAPAA